MKYLNGNCYVEVRDHRNRNHPTENIFLRIKGYCFVKCIIFLNGGEYKGQYLDFIRNETRRSNIMTMACIQPCPKKLGIDLGYYNGERVFPRTVTNRDSALFFIQYSFLFNLQITRC